MQQSTPLLPLLLQYLHSMHLTLVLNFGLTTAPDSAHFSGAGGRVFDTRPSHTLDFKIGNLVADPPGVWH